MPRLPCSIRDVAHDLRLYRDDARSCVCDRSHTHNEDCNEGLDVRLQVHDGRWYVHTGDSSYDQDHRGHWGCGFIPARGRVNFRDLARDLVDQVRESIAMNGGAA